MRVQTSTIVFAEVGVEMLLKQMLGLGFLLVLSGILCASDKPEMASLHQKASLIHLPEWLSATEFFVIEYEVEDDDWENAIWPPAPAGHQEDVCSPLLLLSEPANKPQGDGEIKNHRRGRVAVPTWRTIDRKGVLKRHPSVENLLQQRKVTSLVENQLCVASSQESENGK